jgi:hypothetical protein
MALEVDPQYKFMEAAKAALDDARSETGLVWKIQKLAAHRQAKWLAGAYLSPMIGYDQAYENVNDLIVVRTLAVIVNPSELNLQEGMHDEMKLIRRVELIFRNRTIKDAPYSVRQLNSLTPDPLWRYQITNIEPADRFLAQAFQMGYDVCATVLATKWPKH